MILRNLSVILICFSMNLLQKCLATSKDISEFQETPKKSRRYLSNELGFLNSPYLDTSMQGYDPHSDRKFNFEPQWPQNELLNGIQNYPPVFKMEPDLIPLNTDIVEKYNNNLVPEINDMNSMMPANNGIEYIDRPALSSFDLSQITRPNILDTYPTLPTKLLTFTYTTQASSTTTSTPTTTPSTTTPQMLTQSKLLTSIQNLISPDVVTIEQKSFSEASTLAPSVNLISKPASTNLSILTLTTSKTQTTNYFTDKTSLPTANQITSFTINNQIPQNSSQSINTIITNPSNSCQECSTTSIDCKKSENFNCCFCKQENSSLFFDIFNSGNGINSIKSSISSSSDPFDSLAQMVPIIIIILIVILLLIIIFFVIKYWKSIKAFCSKCVYLSECCKKKIKKLSKDKEAEKPKKQKTDKITSTTQYSSRDRKNHNFNQNNNIEGKFKEDLRSLKEHLEHCDNGVTSVISTLKEKDNVKKLNKVTGRKNELIKQVENIKHDIEKVSKEVAFVIKMININEQANEESSENGERLSSSEVEDSESENSIKSSNNKQQIRYPDRKNIGSNEVEKNLESGENKEISLGDSSKIKKLNKINFHYENEKANNKQYSMSEPVKLTNIPLNRLANQELPFEQNSNKPRTREIRSTRDLHEIKLDE